MPLLFCLKTLDADFFDKEGIGALHFESDVIPPLADKVRIGDAPAMFQPSIALRNIPRSARGFVAVDRFVKVHLRRGVGMDGKKGEMTSGTGILEERIKLRVVTERFCAHRYAPWTCIVAWIRGLRTA